jgi:hypothetical protein
MIPIGRFPRFSVWRDSGRDIVVNGNMVYSLGDTSFRTEFEAALLYSQAPDHSGHVKTRWRNRTVV